MLYKFFFLIVLLLTGIQNNPLLAQNMNTKGSTTLNHIAVYVQDLQLSTHFYSNIIGLDTIPEPFHDGRHTWYKIGPQSQLHLIQGAGLQYQQNKNSHLCFSVPSVEDFVSTLKKNNIEFEDWAGEKNKITIRVDSVKQIYFKDPDGYWIEINNDRL
jgi:lactoylglutathione lyase